VEWIYESTPAETKDHSFLTQTPSAIPCQETVQTLFQLAKKGHLKKLLLQLDEVEQSDAQFAPFIDQIRQLTRSFQMDRTCTFLEHYLQKKEG
jgi:hypothetical protein